MESIIVCKDPGIIDIFQKEGQTYFTALFFHC